MLGPDEAEPVWAFFRDRFGVPREQREEWLLFLRSDTYWGLSRPEQPIEDLLSLRMVSVGLPFARKVVGYIKPTSASLRLLAPWITENRIFLDERQAVELLANREISRSENELTPGYVLIDTLLGVLGCGLLRRDSLISQIPKADANHFLGNAS